MAKEMNLDTGFTVADPPLRRRPKKTAPGPEVHFWKRREEWISIPGFPRCIALSGFSPDLDPLSIRSG